ncbi:polcalcin [Acrasis kona]|uniref:Polcalcin n=1 Tax=Acrasis kona TaxID=1008807 RepID=A0AAW2Z6S7_9EUKA
MSNLFDKLTPEQQAAVDSCFKRIDIDRSGQLTEEELGNMLKLLGEPSTPEHTKRLMKEIDTNGDGRVSWLEFRESMAKYFLN